MSQILILYYSLKDGNNEYIINDELYIKINKRLEAKLCGCDIKSYLMKECSDLLPPLNFWDKGEYKLDEWQREVIDFIKGKKSVLVRAPTSSGKTFVAMASGILHKKILYICPAKPVAFQVGGNFVKMGYNVHYLVENMGHLSYDKDTNIFIGTPYIIEKYLPKIYTQFDYVVLDEIHNVNDMISYENLIKLIQCPFLALSATIENIDFLKSIFQKIHPDKNIEYVEYKKRFINIQRWIYNDRLENLHPLACIDETNLDSIKEITFTPKDLINTYETIYDIFENAEDDLTDEIEYLSPDNYFKEDKILTLDDTKDYESFIKNEIKILSSKYPQYIKEAFIKFKNVSQTRNPENFIQLFKDCKKKNLLPMLYFHTREEEAGEIFLNIYEELQVCENESYPFHYDILKKKNDLYKKYIDKRITYSDSIKIKTNDARTEKGEKMERYDKEQKNKYISDVADYYNRCIYKCEGKQKSNLVVEYNEFIENPDFREIDIFKKHPNYVFSRGEPMSGEEIKSIRREIKKSIGLTIDYENPYFQLLKRGIGLYISSMPDVYNWILQRLMSEKKLGIVVSDKTLCLGIDLPIRSVVLSGYKNPNYTTSDYLQMSGRAGRRGHDTQGNIIFHGVENYLDLMRGDLPKIVGSDIQLGNSYSLINDINKNINTEHLNWRIDNQIQKLHKINLNSKIYKLGWNLRYYQKIETFLQEMVTMEKKIFRIDEDSRELWFYRYILKNLTDYDIDLYINIYKSNKINENINKMVKNLIELGEIHKHIVNSLDNTYMITKNNSRIIFDKLRNIVYKYRGFE
jgi:superfamily II RNA helicase